MTDIEGSGEELVRAQLHAAVFPVYGQNDTDRTRRIVEMVMAVVAPHLTPRPPLEQIAGTLAGHIPDEGLNECSCGRWEHWDDEYDQRVATLTAHQAEAVMGLLEGSPQHS